MPAETPHDKELPDKLFFKVGEVSTIAGVPAYVLQFWEKEFNRIKPKRTPSGQRLYRRKDVELILEIKHLLYDKKFTIPGARQRLKTGLKKSRPLQGPSPWRKSDRNLNQFRKFCPDSLLVTSFILIECPCNPTCNPSHFSPGHQSE